MRLTTTLIIVLAISFASCKSKTALNYNNEINKIEASLKEDVRQTEEKVGRYIQQQQYDSAAATSERMETLVGTKLAELEAIPAPDVKEGENLKKAAIRYFQFMKNVYTTYKGFAMNPTEEERQKVVRNSDGARDALVEIQTAQKKYAEANGFRIETK